MSKHTRLVIIALFTLAIIFLLNSSADANSVVVGESTEAVERTDIIREKSDILIDCLLYTSLAKQWYISFRYGL